MRNIFIINPAAGPEGSEDKVKAAIMKHAAGNCSIEVYQTKCPGDATEFVRSLCASTEEPLRLYACGGDGTLNEVVNGAAGFKNAAVGCYPCGSGNDFVKFFGGAQGFMDIGDQLAGSEMEIDMIKADGKYCVNVANFGLESAVVIAMREVKNKPFLSGRNGYFAGILKAFIKNMKTRCRVVADGELLADGDILLCNLANGGYAGGSFNCAPRAVIDDGLMELCLVKPMSRPRFISMAMDYAKGLHLDKEKFKPYIIYRRCREVEVFSDDEKFSYVLDGEVSLEKSFTAQVEPVSLKLIIPRGLEEYLHKKDKEVVM